LILLRIAVFVVLIGPLFGAILGTLVGIALFGTFYLGWTWGVAIGVPLGFVASAVLAWIPATGHMIGFVSILALSIIICVVPIAFLQLGPLVFPSIGFAILISVILYFYIYTEK